MLHLVRDGDALHVLLHEHDEVEGVVQVRLLKQRLGKERLQRLLLQRERGERGTSPDDWPPQRTMAR